MLSNALRVSHRPSNTRKSREKRVEAKAPQRVPGPVQPMAQAEPRPIIWKHVALGTAAVAAQLKAVGLAADTFVPVSVSRLLTGEMFENRLLLGFSLDVAAANAGILLSLLVSGALFFKKQQRVPMLFSGLAWIALLDWFPTVFHHTEWPCVTAAVATLAAALALGKRGPEKPPTPIE